MYNNKNIGVYIHIPFCLTKCNYCDFLSFSLKNEDEYIDALCNEIDSFDDGFVADTIFFGGGTPSIIKPRNIEKIFRYLHKKFIIPKDNEITIEMNPATFDKDKLTTYMDCGINRLSIGCQTTNDTMLKKLGRIHTYKEFMDGYFLARKVGFRNINVDIMAALPSQTIKMHIEDIDKILNLDIEHISIYGLIIEGDTPFFVLYNEENGTNVDELMNDDEAMNLYEITNNLLRQSNFFQYEISNYSKRGFECRHNIKYWKRDNYVGFGLGASGLIDDIRYKNTQDFVKYILKDYSREKEYLTNVDINNEILMLGLRLNEGIDRKVIFNISNEKKLNQFINQGLLEELNKSIKLTKKGREISNYVISELML